MTSHEGFSRGHAVQAEFTQRSTSGRADLEAGLWLVLLLLAVYLLTYNGVLRVTDGQAMFAVAENLVKHASPDARQLDNWEDVHVGVNGLPYAKYPLGPSLAIAPFYSIGLLSGGRIGLAQTAMLLPVLATALTGGLVFLTARRLGYSRGIAIAGGLLYGLATIAWVYTRDLWSEPLSGLFLSLAFYTGLRYRQGLAHGWIVLSAISLGLLVLAKTVNILLVPLFFLYAFDWIRPAKRSWLDMALFVGIVGLAIALVGGYNWARFGNALDSGYDPDEIFSTPVWAGGGGLLLSPYKGLLWYNPVLLLAIWGAVDLWKRHRREVGLILAILLAHAIVFGAWWNWWGGESWGPRFLVPVLPLVILLVSPLLASGRVRWLVVGIATLSVAAQVISVLAAEPYLPGWTDESFRNWFLPSNWAWRDWPFIGHLLRFEPQGMAFAWSWYGQQSARHLDWLALGVLALNLVIATTGLLAAQPTSRGLPNWLGVGAALLAGVFLLGRVESDPRYIKNLDNPSDYQAAYDELLAHLPAGAAVVLTDKRFEPYFFNHFTPSNAWYTLAKPDHAQTLATVSNLLGQERGPVAVVTDDLDNTLLPYAIEQWLSQRRTRRLRQTIDGKVQMSMFEPRAGGASPESIPPAPVFEYTADPETATLRKIATLLGWDVIPDDDGRMPFSVYWIHQGKAAGEPFFLRLMTPDGRVLA